MEEVDTNEKKESSESAIGAFLFIAAGGITGGAVAYAVMTIADIFISIDGSNLIYSLAEASVTIVLVILYIQIFSNYYLYRLE
ncbi:hypothetical protein [Natrinema salinisoli]|uniref:hypothetical protein n=1 Tax=Natrinema salinisoli TaxID=2878535 RepID=UPI001CF0C0EE|nr:hypothetical protein [Natrinema salinisoli]